MSESKNKSASKSKPKETPKAEPKSKTVKKAKSAEAKSDASKPLEHGPPGYSIGEGQKTVTKKYRRGWDAIFGTKR